MQVDEAAQAELAYVLAGVGGRPRKRWATWWEPGRRAPARPLELHLQPEGPACEPLRPLQCCAWQGLAAVGSRRLEEGAGPTEALTQQAREAAAALHELGSREEAEGRMVPDGVQGNPRTYIWYLKK